MTTKHLEFLPTYSPGDGKPLEILFPRSGAPWSLLDEGDFIWATFNTRRFQGSRWRDSESYPTSPFGAPAPETLSFSPFVSFTATACPRMMEIFSKFSPVHIQVSYNRNTWRKTLRMSETQSPRMPPGLEYRVGMQLWQAFYTARVIKGGNLALLKQATENRMLASLATLLSNWSKALFFFFLSKHLPASRTC